MDINLHDHLDNVYFILKPWDIKSSLHSKRQEEKYFIEIVLPTMILSLSVSCTRVDSPSQLELGLQDGTVANYVSLALKI